MTSQKTTRRSALQTLAAGVAIAGASRMATSTPTRAQAGQRKFLFVVGGLGGGSIIDSFMPIARADSNDINLNTFEDNSLAQVGNLRCVQTPRPLDFYGFPVNGYLRQFLTKHGADTAVLTQESTSVNHLIAQKRSMNGAGINKGQTLLEAAALRHGDGLLLPAINMAGGGYLDFGDDAVPTRARALPVADALRFAFATDARQGIIGAPSKALLDRMRGIRRRLDNQTPFGATYRNAPLRQQYLEQRDVLVPQVESLELINKLTLIEESPTAPLSMFGLSSSSDLPALRERFPQLDLDPLQAQAALAFLLVKNGLSCAVAISASDNPIVQEDPNPPLAFDFSHTDHAVAQYAMWSRLLRITDGLIDLLKATPLDANNPAAGTYWDHSVVYFATDFGRDKYRATNSPAWSSGHHLNNGNVVVSPLVNGDRVYGGVDVNTGLTYGFDRNTGEALPDALMHEGDIYSAVAHALDIPFQGRLDMPALVRSA
jgi:hypothetical protein